MPRLGKWLIAIALMLAAWGSTPFASVAQTPPPNVSMTYSGQPTFTNQSITVPTGTTVTVATGPGAEVNLFSDNQCTSPTASWQSGWNTGTVYNLTLWTQARWYGNLTNVSGCYSITWGTGSPSVTPTPVPTEIPPSPPSLTLNGVTSSISVAVNDEVLIETDLDTAGLNVWDGPACEGETSLSLDANTVTIQPTDVGVISVQAYNQNNRDIVSACLHITASVATAVPTAVPTNVPTTVPTPLPTMTPTTAPTTVPTIAPTVMPTTAPTTEPTGIATTEPTTIPTAPPTMAPTIAPTIEATTASTTVPTAVVTAGPTEVPTGVPTATTSGSAIVTVSTEDGSEVPDGTTVCVGIVCQTASGMLNAAAVSPITLTFSDLAPGTYPVSVTNAAPYQDMTSSISIAAGETTTIAFVLPRAAETATMIPTEAGAATPITTVTTGPTAIPGGGTTVTTLPNTGSGQGASTMGLLVLVLAMLAIAAAGSLAWRRSR